jgi:hypothetical protein
MLQKNEKDIKPYHISIRKFISDRYAWACVFSYDIRNWLVHEGWFRAETPLFKSNQIKDRLIMSNAAKTYIDAETQKNYNTNCKRSNEEYDQWNNGDLAEILVHCHQKIDSLFESLLPWSIESLKMQVKLFK